MSDDNPRQMSNRFRFSIFSMLTVMLICGIVVRWRTDVTSLRAANDQLTGKVTALEKELTVSETTRGALVKIVNLHSGRATKQEDTILELRTQLAELQGNSVSQPRP